MENYFPGVHGAWGIGQASYPGIRFLQSPPPSLLPFCPSAAALAGKVRRGLSQVAVAGGQTQAGGWADLDAHPGRPLTG